MRTQREGRGKVWDRRVHKPPGAEDAGRTQGASPRAFPVPGGTLISDFWLRHRENTLLLCAASRSVASAPQPWATNPAHNSL